MSKEFFLKHAWTLVFSAVTAAGFGQTYLSLEEAVNRALENEHNIRIARNNELIAVNSNTAGNAGMLPTVTFTGDYTYSLQNTEQKFFSGDIRAADNAANQNFRLSLGANWTAFDGFKMFATRDKLALLENQSRLFTQEQLHLTAFTVQQAYYNVARLQRSIDIYRRAIELDKDIKQLAENRLRLGSGTQFQVLQAATQLQTDSIRLVQQQADLQLAQVALNDLTGQDLKVQTLTDTAFQLFVIPSLDNLIALSKQQNPSLAVRQQEILIAEKTIKEEESALYPKLNLTANYNYNTSRSEVGFLLSSFSYGPVLGVNVTYDLYTGRSIQKDLQSARLYRENQILASEDAAEQIQTAITQAYRRYENARQLVELEGKNVALAARNSTLARELLRAGKTTDFEVREAVLLETEAQDRQLDAQFRLKLSEIELFYLIGQPLYALK